MLFQRNYIASFNDASDRFFRSNQALLICQEGCEHYTLHDDDEAQQMPLKWYECQPVMSKKIVVMHLQLAT